MSVWKYLFSLEERRYWWQHWVRPGPLKAYYDTAFPRPQDDWRTLEYVALDFETTGLDPSSDEILSIGFTLIRRARLQLASNTHLLVRPSGPIPEHSAVVHGILDDQAARARPLEQATPLLLQALAGRVLLAHHAAIEYLFLDRACRRLYGRPFIGPVVDTLALEVRQFRAQDRAPKSGELRLFNARTRYGLPRYRAHNALLDAIAAGELFLAQAAHRQGRKPLTLKDLSVIT